MGAAARSRTNVLLGYQRAAAQRSAAGTVLRGWHGQTRLQLQLQAMADLLHTCAAKRSSWSSYTEGWQLKIQPGGCSKQRCRTCMAFWASLVPTYSSCACIKLAGQIEAHLACMLS